jgi:SAM-dependent methyltransferase
MAACEGGVSAIARWDAAIAEHIPPDWILRQAPESPLAYPPSLFRASNGRVTASMTERMARAGLGSDKSVLDVGSGGGAASIGLAAHARTLVAVDPSTAMLANFAEAAESAGVAHREIVGRWPDVADRAPRCDVVLCRNVVYLVDDGIAPFVSALADRAVNRVVVELTEQHPGQTVAALWKEFWDHEIPEGPTADDFVDVVRELGFNPTVRTELRVTGNGAPRDQYVPFVRRRLCLTADRDPEIDAALGPELPLVVAVTVAWSPQDPR